MNAAAIASIAAVVCADGGWHAKCFNEKRARNRRGRGTISDARALRRASTVVSTTDEASAGFMSIAEGDMLSEGPPLQFKILINQPKHGDLGDRIFGGDSAGHRNLNFSAPLLRQPYGL